MPPCRLAASHSFAFLLAICISSTAMAQTSPFVFTRQIDSLLWHLDKSEAKLLYDRVFPIARLHNFSAHDTSVAAHFDQAVYELYAVGLASAYNGPPNNPFEPTPINPQISNDTAPGPGQGQDHGHSVPDLQGLTHLKKTVWQCRCSAIGLAAL